MTPPLGAITTDPVDDAFATMFPKAMSWTLTIFNGVKIVPDAFAGAVEVFCAKEAAENPRITIAERSSFFMIFAFLMGLIVFKIFVY